MTARRALGWVAVATAAVVVAVLLLQWRGAGTPGPSASGIVVASGAVSASASAAPPPPSASTTASGTARTGASGVKHVWIIVMENHSYGQLMGSDQAPFLNELAGEFGAATDYHGVGRPSEPNYLALISGSTQGVTDDGVHDITAPTVLDQLEQAGHTWAVYAENVPPNCFRGATAHDGPDGSGTYARKHEPAISFTGISGDPVRCARITDFSHFSVDAADFNLIVPNQCHDMHDCSVARGDAWLRSFVPQITGSAAFADGGLLVVTFDEAEGGDDSQHTALVFAGPAVAAGARLTTRADHYALLRTVQDAFGLPCLAQSCHAEPMPALLGAAGG